MATQPRPVNVRLSTEASSAAKLTEAERGSVAIDNRIPGYVETHDLEDLDLKIEVSPEALTLAPCERCRTEKPSRSVSWRASMRRFTHATCVMVFLSCAVAPAWGQSDSPVAAPTFGSPGSYDQYLKDLGIRTYLSPEDTRNYGASLNSLVGMYFYINAQGEMIKLGRPDKIPVAATVQLKDKIEFQRTIDETNQVSISIPWVSALFKKSTKTILTIQDMVTVIGTSSPDIISANRPKASDDRRVLFVSAATVTLVSATRISNKSFDGATPIKIGGSKVFMDNSLQNAWIISLSLIEVGDSKSIGRGVTVSPADFRGRVISLKPASP